MLWWAAPCRRNYGWGGPWAVRHSHSSAHLAGGSPKISSKCEIAPIWGHALRVVTGSFCGRKGLNKGGVIINFNILLHKTDMSRKLGAVSLLLGGGWVPI